MIIRVVKLHIASDAVEQFIHFFNEHKNDIASFEGCHSLELFRDVMTNEHLITYSIWEDSTALDRYRQSDLFGEIWPKAKKWFKSRPKAHSYEYIKNN